MHIFESKSKILIPKWEFGCPYYNVCRME